MSIKSGGGPVEMDKGHALMLPRPSQKRGTRLWLHKVPRVSTERLTWPERLNGQTESDVEVGLLS